MVGKKHPFTSYPAEKHTKRGKFAITDMREKTSGPFLLYDTEVDLEIILLT